MESKGNHRPRKTTRSNSAEERNENEEVDGLRESLIKNFSMFLLNNILMSVQFFENYERDVEPLRERCLEESSIENGQFKCFNADSLHELVGSRVLFQKKSCTKKESSELIHPIRTFVIYQNVELDYQQSSLSKNKSHNLPHFKFIVQACEDDEKEEAGYVNVIELEATEDKAEAGVGMAFLSHPDANDGTADVGQSGNPIAKNNHFHQLEPGKRLKPYTLSTYRTHEKTQTSSSIPKSCFREIEKQILANAGRRVGLFKGKQKIHKDVKKMLMSSAFKRHFCEVFVTRLAARMKFEKLNPDAAVFHHESINVKKDVILHQTVPALQLKEWASCATDFPESVYKGKSNRMEWPTKNMQTILKRTGCILVPTGYYEASDKNNDYALEWKLDFPKAEKYLMMHMMHAHIRCYLFALIIYKTFIETESHSIHFGPRHIANLLLLLVRKNFLIWPECNQGESLIRFLKILCKSLQKKRLKSFFIHKRNLYAASPLRVIHRAQILLMRILENPILYVLKALMNLRYKEKFYPEFDFQLLYKVLTVEDLLGYLNPKPQNHGKSKREKSKQNTEEGNGEQRKEEPTIDVEKMFNERNTPLLRKEVLRIFIRHFISIGNRSRQFGDCNQAMLYLRHARHLTALLGEEYVSPSEVNELLDRINNESFKSTNPKTTRDRNGDSKGYSARKSESEGGEEKFMQFPFEKLAFTPFRRRDFFPREGNDAPDEGKESTNQAPDTSEDNEEPDDMGTKL